MNKSTKGCVNCGADDHDTKDCTRLPVLGWYHSHAEVATSDKARVASWLTECVEPLCRLSDAQALIAELRAERDAFRDSRNDLIEGNNQLHDQIAEKNARIAQLAAHARGKNKALANALKEIERWKSLAEGANEISEICLSYRERADRLGLQSAPAERGVVMPEQAETPEPYGWIAAGKFFTCREDAIDAAGKTSCLEVYSRPQLIGVLARSAGRQTVAEELARLLKRSGEEVRELKARLNPAPATADSDVREVSE